MFDICPLKEIKIAVVFVLIYPVRSTIFDSGSRRYFFEKTRTIRYTCSTERCMSRVKIVHSAERKKLNRAQQEQDVSTDTLHRVSSVTRRRQSNKKMRALKSRREGDRGKGGAGLKILQLGGGTYVPVQCGLVDTWPLGR